MDFSADGEQGRSMTGLGVAIAAHLLLGYALINGLAMKVVQVLKDPLQVNLLEEIKPPPPPPPILKPLPTPPKVVPPPPAYVPPPQVEVKTPPVETIAAVTTAPPPPVEVRPAPVEAPPPVGKAAPVEAPPAPVVAPVVAVGAACPNYAAVRNKVEVPPQAQVRGINGDVLVEFTVTASGALSNLHIAKSSNPIFNDAALNVISRNLQCIGQGQDVRVRIPFSFRLSQ